MHFFYNFRFCRAHRPILEDMRGIEGLYDNLLAEADEAVAKRVKYKELGSKINENGHKQENGKKVVINGC